MLMLRRAFNTWRTSWRYIVFFDAITTIIIGFLQSDHVIKQLVSKVLYGGTLRLDLLISVSITLRLDLLISVSSPLPINWFSQFIVSI